MQNFINEIMQSPLFGLYCGILGSLAGFLIGNRLALGRDRRNDFNRAAEKLRDTFQPIRLMLNPYHYALEEDIYNILEKNFDIHKGAVLEFSNYIRRNKTKRAFLQAWYEYHCSKDDYHENCMLNLIQYTMVARGFTFEQKHEMLKLIETRIKNILKFAQPK